MCKFCANSWQSLNGATFKIKAKGGRERKASLREYRRIPLASPGLIHAHFVDLVGLYTGWAYARIGLYTGLRKWQ